MRCSAMWRAARNVEDVDGRQISAFTRVFDALCPAMRGGERVIPSRRSVFVATCGAISTVMPALVAGIHVLLSSKRQKDPDGRNNTFHFLTQRSMRLYIHGLARA